MNNENYERIKVLDVFISKSMIWGNEKEFWTGGYKLHKLEITKYMLTNTYTCFISYREKPVYKSKDHMHSFKEAMEKVKQIIDNRQKAQKNKV